LINRRFVATTIAALSLLGGLAACSDIGEEYATSTSDTHVCVFDGSERGGQKLKFQVAPGAESKKIDDNDQVVKIPASNRFWMVSPDRSVADPGTPEWYTGNAAGGVPIVVSGQIRFRFNLDNACEWYSKHGRRNADEDGDLRFNARGDDALNSGWFKHGNENFVPTMQEVITEEMSAFEWAFLHYNYPVNADAAGVVEGEPGDHTRQAVGKVLGDAYTERLEANLGGEYFCGIGSTADDPCPPISFQVTYAGPGQDSPLVKDRERVEQTKQALETARLEADLTATQQQALIDGERRKAELLALQAQNAQRQAQIDNAKCIELAKYGLDCEGHHPTYNVRE
jgi:hypothetical protein